MNELEELRKRIDKIDRELLPLFLERMEVCSKVADYKRKVGMAVLDSKREAEVLAEKVKLAQNTDMTAEVYEFFNSVMSISRVRQTRELTGEKDRVRIEDIINKKATPKESPTVCYFGSHGAYSEEAAVKFFGEDTRRFSAKTFEDVFLSLSRGEADYGVVPIENSSTGAIAEVVDLISKYGYYIVGETYVPIRHCLMGIKGAKLEDIKMVYSHEQGILQSGEFLNSLGGVTCEAHESTSISAKLVADKKDKSVAAIAGRRNAEIYDLDILAEDINSFDLNTTRFAIISKNFEFDEDSDKISISFTLPHESGQLHRLLASFAQGGLNLLKLESRPIPQKPFEYMFFADYTGNLNDSNVKAVTNSGIEGTMEFNLLGNYKSHISEGK